MGAAAITRARLPPPETAKSLEAAQAAAELKELEESIPKFEALLSELKPIVDGAEGAEDTIERVTKARQSMYSILGLVSTRKHNQASNGVNVKGGVDEMAVHWSAWWNDGEEGRAAPAGGFRILLKKAGGNDKWGFIMSNEVASPEAPKIVRAHLARGTEYDIKIQALDGDGKTVLKSSDLIEIFTWAAEVDNICANAGPDEVQCWWRFKGDADANPKYKVLVREKPDDGSKQPWSWMDAPKQATPQDPLRVTADALVGTTKLNADTCFQMCVRYEVGGQTFDSEPIEFQTGVAGPRATNVGATGAHESLSVWWDYDGDASDKKFLVCARPADAGAHVPWGYVVTDQCASKEAPYTYTPEEKLWPHTMYAICVKVEYPDGSTTTSDVVTTLTDVTSAAHDMAEKDQALLQAEREKLAAEQQAKRSSLEERLAKARKARKNKKKTEGAETRPAEEAI
jgi:hypothetical protein